MSNLEPFLQLQSRLNPFFRAVCFIKVIECLQYFAWQGLAMQGDTDDESNFIQLLKLRGKYRPLLRFKMVRKERR